MYIMDVANISHNAGTSKMKGLKLLEPLVSTLLSTEPSYKQINMINTVIKLNSFSKNKNHRYLQLVDYNNNRKL